MSYQPPNAPAAYTRHSSPPPPLAENAPTELLLAAQSSPPSYETTPPTQSPYSDLPTQRMPTAPPAQSEPVGLAAEEAPTRIYARVVMPLPAPVARKTRRRVIAVASIVGVVVLIVAIVFASQIARPSTPLRYASAMTAVDNDWPNQQDCRFKADGYHITGPSMCYYDASDYRNGSIAVTARQLSGASDSAYGIAVRRSGPTAFYAFEITSDAHWYVRKGAILVSSGASQAIKTSVGASNLLDVSMAGADFTFSVNGQTVATTSDVDYAQGKLGVTGDQNLDVVYTDLTILPTP